MFRQTPARGGDIAHGDGGDFNIDSAAARADVCGVVVENVKHAAADGSGAEQGDAEGAAGLWRFVWHIKRVNYNIRSR